MLNNKGKTIMDSLALTKAVLAHEEWVNSGRNEGKRIELRDVAIDGEVAAQVFSGANLYGARFIGVNFYSDGFKRSQIENANFARAEFHHCETTGALLTFRNSSLQQSSLAVCKFNALEFIGESNLKNMQIGYSSLYFLKIGQSCETEGIRLFDSNFYSSHLRYVDLRSSTLFTCQLSRAKLPKETFVVLGEGYDIDIAHGTHLRAGCQQHTIDQWYAFSRSEVGALDIDNQSRAISFYPRLLDIIEFYLPENRGRKRPEWITSLKEPRQ